MASSSMEGILNSKGTGVILSRVMVGTRNKDMGRRWEVGTVEDMVVGMDSRQGDRGWEQVVLRHWVLVEGKPI